MKLKTLLAIVLTASAAFAQPARRELTPPPSVTYQWISPDCTGIEGAFSQISSGCAFTKLQVTAHSSNVKVAGFYILVTFHDTIDDYRTATTFTRESDGSFTALFIIGDPSTVSIREVSALELVEGQLATAH